MAASSKAELEELHRLVTRSYKSRIEMDLRDEIPTDAATLSGAAKFLKDNEVTADPADVDDLKGLREKLKATEEARRVRNGKLLSVVSNDLDEAL